MTSSDAWLTDLFEEHGARLHRLTVVLGAESESGHILRTALIGLARRERRIVDPTERVEYLAEQVVHQARVVRGSSPLVLLEVADARQREICEAIVGLPPKFGEILVTSHYLSIFGPELARIMRMTVKKCNQRLETARVALRKAVGDPAPTSQPGAIESLSDEVTAALRSATRLVQAPGTETLELELRSFNEHRRRGLPLSIAASIVGGALVIGGSIAWATTSRPTRQPSPSVVTATVPSASTSQSLPAQVHAVPVYYVGRDDRLLYRELRALPVSGDLLQTSISAILSLAPQDPDYVSAWTPGRILAATLEGNTLTIDLSATAYANFTTEADAARAKDQMVYTAAEVLQLPGLAVQFKADGGSPPELFTGLHRRSGLDPLGKLWINTPSNGAKVGSGQVVITGLTQPTAAAPRVVVSGGDAAEVASLSAQVDRTPNSDGWLEWTATVELKPGSYHIAVEDVYESAGNVQETRTVTVS